MIPIPIVINAVYSARVPFRKNPMITPHIPSIETRMISILPPFSDHKQFLNTLKQFINIGNDPEKNDEKPCKTDHKCLLVPPAVFQHLRQNGNMIVTSIPRPLPPDFILLPKQNRKHCTAENSQTVIQFFLCRSSFLRLLYHPFEFTFIE